MILEVDGVEFSYKSIKALRKVKFSVKSSEIVSILGPNGGGKSTLLKCIAKILIPKRGAVCIDKKNILDLKTDEIAKIIGFVPQSSTGNYLTVFDAILLGRKPHIGWDVTDRDIQIASNILKLLDLENLALRFTNELSGGELQKVTIGRALAQEPRILLLDEPTNNLDPKNQIEIMELINSITKEKDMITIVVMHDLNLALMFSDKFILLKNGEIFAVGNHEIITKEIIHEVYDINVEIIHYKGLPIIVPQTNGIK